MTRADATLRTLALTRCFWTSPHASALDGTGQKGFSYDFLDRITGRRAGLCEVLTIVTTFLLARHTRRRLDGMDLRNNRIQRFG